MKVFGLGSTAARALCQAFDLDPDELPPKRRRGSYTPIMSVHFSGPASAFLSQTNPIDTMRDKGKTP